LLRRRVIRVAAVYIVVGWIIIEVAATVLPPLGLPGWAITLVIALIALGFPIAVAMGWMFDIGPHGVERTPPAAGPGGEQPAGYGGPPAARAQGDGLPGHVGDFTGDRLSIAVLPFVNLSGDIDNEYFSDGISEEILNLLTKLPQLKVASRTSSFFFKGKEIDIPTVAAKLRASAILEGSVRRAGTRVRITAELIDARSDSHLWSEIYDRELADVFAIQEDIARSIVDALQVTLSPKERRSIQYVATADVQAYDAYLRGRIYFYDLTRRYSLRAI
jgi:adenylate cyclase